MVIHQNILLCFIGTYTKNQSEGIYRILFNKDTKKVEKFNLAYEIDNPTYLTIDNERHILYTPCQINDKAGVASFKYWKEQDKLNFVNCSLSESKQPCHVSICEDNQILISSNYHENKMIIYNSLDGLILNSNMIGSHQSNSINSDLHGNPHIHCSLFTYDKKYILSVDLGINMIVVSEIIDNKLVQRNDLSYSLPAHSGPRHITYCNKDYYYVLSELTSEIFVLKYNPDKKPIFETIQTLSSLPAEYTGKKSGAAIRIHPNNKLLYTSDRVNNSISLFNILPNGKLQYVNSFSCMGNSPRDFDIDPSGSFLFCANQNSNNVSIFSINKLNGELTFIDSEKVFSPTSITFG